MELKVRKVATGDLEAVLPLIDEFVASFELEHETCRASFHRLVDEESASVLVAELGDAVVGYCLGFVQ